VIVANPKTAGVARWIFLALWGSKMKKGAAAAAKEYVTKVGNAGICFLLCVHTINKMKLSRYTLHGVTVLYVANSVRRVVANNEPASCCTCVTGA
jgi:hypothetical protein